MRQFDELICVSCISLSCLHRPSALLFSLVAGFSTAHYGLRRLQKTKTKKKQNEVKPHAVSIVSTDASCNHNSHLKYVTLIKRVRSPKTTLWLCVFSLQDASSALYFTAQFHVQMMDFLNKCYNYAICLVLPTAPIYVHTVK